MTDLERARAVFAKTAYATEVTGCVIDAVGDGCATCSLALTDAHKNGLGIPMGGAIFTLADFAFAVASNFDRDVYLSTSAEIRFLTPAQGGSLTAEAKPLHLGRRTCLYEVNVRDGTGALAAVVTVSGQLAQVRKRQ